MPARIAVIALLLSSLVPQPSFALSAKAMRARVDSLILRGYIHGLPYEDAHRLGTSALPRLAEILADTTLRPHWANATAAVGAIGGPRAFHMLRSFIWDRFSGPVDQPTYWALTGAVSVLGFTCGPSDSRVVALLEAHAAPEQWSDVRWSWGSLTKTRALLTKLAIYDLGYCGTAGAREALLRLARNPRHHEQAGMIASALHLHEEVVKAGGHATYMALSRSRRAR
ncbi:MAG: hypothetical protein ACM3PF_14785 [Bacteroidota bacterium]